MTTFGHDTWWLVAAKAIAVFVFLMLTVLVAILAERKLLGRMQLRPGPTGLAQKEPCRAWLTASSWRSKRASHPVASIDSYILWRRSFR